MAKNKGTIRMTEVLDLVFVYGSLLNGLGNHGVLARSGARFVGEARTADSDLRMLSYGGFPAVYDAAKLDADADAGPVTGELYRVDTAGMADLDRLEGHPTFYRRERRTLIMADGTECTAWIYLLRRPSDRGWRGGSLPHVPAREDGVLDWRAYHVADLAAAGAQW